MVNLDAAPADFWEQRYAGADRVWSGRVNQVVADVAARLTPGTALDLGCGEGADAIWLARHGWTATGIDISPSAVRHAAGVARDQGVPDDRIRFAAADLATLSEPGRYDLVTASFLQSPVDLPRIQILRTAAEWVGAGGHLLITAHASGPPGAQHQGGHGPQFVTPAQDVDALRLDPDEWTVRVAEVRPRDITGPDGSHASIDDSVVLIKRR
jgi:SAM-dependent methyltransferase